MTSFLLRRSLFGNSSWKLHNSPSRTKLLVHTLSKSLSKNISASVFAFNSQASQKYWLCGCKVGVRKCDMQQSLSWRWAWEIWEGRVILERGMALSSYNGKEACTLLFLWRQCSTRSLAIAYMKSVSLVSNVIWIFSSWFGTTSSVLQ